MPGPPFERLLKESIALDEELQTLLASAGHDNSERSRIGYAMCEIAVEHAAAFRLLASAGLGTSALAILRIHVEAVVRAVWVTYAAPEIWVSKYAAPLKSQADAERRSSPPLEEMLADLSKIEPPTIHQMLRGLKDNTWKSLNSYVHTGIHPIAHMNHGVPIQLIDQTLRISNALSTMVAMTRVQMSGDQALVGPMRAIQLGHASCLPPLISPTN